MLRFASLMRSAMRRLTPITLISVVSGTGAPGAGGSTARDIGTATSPAADLASERPPAATKSPRKMRPPGPLPAMLAKSIPASRARRRFAGEAITRPDRGGAGAVTAGSVAAGAAGTTGIAAAALAAGAGSAPAANSNTINGEPTATLSPGSPVIDTTRPLTGAGTSTAALSVITSTMT